MTTTRTSDRERGAAAVEFALVVPLLLTLVFGLVTFGLLFANQLTMNAAARNAARSGVVQPVGGAGSTCSTLAALARSGASMLGASPTMVGVTVTGPDGTTSCSLAAGSTTVSGTAAGTSMCTGSSKYTNPMLTVTMTYAYTSPMPLVPGTYNLTSVGKFLCEYN